VVFDSAQSCLRKIIVAGHIVMSMTRVQMGSAFGADAVSPWSVTADVYLQYR